MNAGTGPAASSATPVPGDGDGANTLQAGSERATAPSSLPRWRVFPALALGTLMATLDISIVNIAMPTLSRVFHASLTTIEWVVLAYILSITGLQLVFGHLADQLGRRRVYLTGLVVFLTASGLCAAAPSAATLIAARALQGLGTAMMMANTSALLVSSFEARERGQALGLFGIAVGAGLALGPPLGGLIVGHLSWRWIFLINLPIGVVAFTIARARLPRDGPRRVSKLPPVNAVLWCVALTTVLLALSRGPVSGWASAEVLAWVALAGMSAAGFVFLERRAAEPLLPLFLMRGTVGTAALLTLMLQTVFVAVGFQLPLFFQDVLGFDAARTGRWLVILPISAFLMAPLAGRWADAIGSRPLTVGGLLIATAGMLAIATLGAAPGAAHLIVALALFGIGTGLFAIPNSTAMFGGAPPERLSLVSGLQATMRNVGISAGTALTGAWLVVRIGALGGGEFIVGHPGLLTRQAFVSASRELYLGLAGLLLVAVLLAALGSPGRPKGP